MLSELGPEGDKTKNINIWYSSIAIHIMRPSFLMYDKYVLDWNVCYLYWFLIALSA